jgi:predicted GH43/DUF377 family glycosyl hydrolase
MKSKPCSPTLGSELVTRLPIRFSAEDSWVVTRPFFPGGVVRVQSVCERVADLADAQVVEMMDNVEAEFYSRHRRMDLVLQEHFNQAAKLVPGLNDLDDSRKLLIGAYFTMEYAFASAALFNPSITQHPDQTGIGEDCLRFIMSLRSTGEGHVSSIVFRTGVLGPNHEIDFDPLPSSRHRMRMAPDRRYDKTLFRRKLRELTVDEHAMTKVLERVGDSFSLTELETAIKQIHQDQPHMYWLEETTASIAWLARENYTLSISPEAKIPEMVIFPQSDNEAMGIEDLRLVRFVEEDNSVHYYGTYSAFNGSQVLPQLMETRDFHLLHMHTLNGAAVKNKGMALFPRRIGGQYCMSSRIDGENLFLMFSDNIHFWQTAEMFHAPRRPWEFVQIGNCGSPIETSEGWLLLTHGVGPMRKYCIGAMLLDRDDPFRVIGDLQEPLIAPTEHEREGYVPNVVYTCGAIMHGDCLFIPYAMSDAATGFAVVSMDRLLNELLANKP